MNNSVFIHFLNRELFRSVKIEKITGTNFALKLLLLAKDSSLYVPLSSVWESGDNTDLDYDFFDLVYESNQIELISDCVTNDEFLDRNSQLYYYDKIRYNCYFATFNRYIKYRPTVLRGNGVTGSIRKELEEWSITRKIQPYLPARDMEIIQINKENIYVVNQKSEGRGITKSLFSGELVNEVHEFTIARMLAVCYILDYLKYVQGDIATGVNRYIRYYDVLTKCFPYNDIPLLSSILECAGVSRNIFCEDKNKEWELFLYRRRNNQHERICRYIYDIIDLCFSYRKGMKNLDIRISSSDLVIDIRRRFSVCSDKIVKINSVNQLDELENNLMILLDCFTKSNSFKMRSESIKGGNTMSENKKVFIVHGHNELLKEQVANWLYSMELEPIILHKKANSGTASIIDKIEKYSDVCCAIILLTADDGGKGINEKRYKKRARQNVIFEAGYFIGKIGAGNVILLYEDGVELPGDLGGCVYIMADDKGGWKELVRTEFNELGIDYRK